MNGSREPNKELKIISDYKRTLSAMLMKDYCVKLCFYATNHPKKRQSFANKKHFFHVKHKQ